VTLLGDPRLAESLVLRLAAVAVLVSTLEYQVNHRCLRDGGLMGWAVGSLRYPITAFRPFELVLNAVLAYPRVRFTIAALSCLAVVVVCGPEALVTSLVLPAAILLGLLLLTIRNGYGLDGADQMTLLVFGGAAVAGVAQTAASTRMFLLFVAFQGCLAYGTAGVAKLLSTEWRDGSALLGITATRIYGNARVHRAVRRHPSLTRIASRSMIAWECLFPLVLVIPPVAVFVILASGALFHLFNGFVMGLNTFTWAFIATYPAILFVAGLRPW